ncbi:hypothetical protein HUJ04_006375 [Dendroctonus ponderosae]|nr:hypothetical protein HUJ04_006375 [Dendroctonus ponderosae]
MINSKKLPDYPREHQIVYLNSLKLMMHVIFTLTLLQYGYRSMLQHVRHAGSAKFEHKFNAPLRPFCVLLNILTNTAVHVTYKCKT